jgi:hypothetical protein
MQLKNHKKKKKISKVETILTNLSLNINPLTQNNTYSPRSLMKLNFFSALEVLNGRLRKSF